MRKFFKLAFDYAFAKAGAQVIPFWRLHNFPQETYLRDLIAKFQIDLIFDVGANVGQYASFLRSAVGYDGWIVSYEPDPEAASKAATRFQNDPKWIMNQCALGAVPGTAQFNIMAGSELNSFLRPSNESIRRYASLNRIERRIDVEVRTIDSEIARFMERLQSERPYLKLDTQGFDLTILSGGGAALQKLIGIQSEMSILPIYADMPDFVQTLTRLREYGFDLSAIFPVNSRHFPLLIEVDGHFVKSDLLAPARQQATLPT